MRYSLSDLLDQAHDERAVALYLSPGLPPIFALRSEPRVASLPSVRLFPVEGPALRSEDTRGVLEALHKDGYTGPSGYASIADFRYHRETYDFDVFVFISTEGPRIEFRVPYVTERGSSANHART